MPPTKAKPQPPAQQKTTPPPAPNPDPAQDPEPDPNVSRETLPVAMIPNQPRLVIFTTGSEAFANFVVGVLSSSGILAEPTWGLTDDDLQYVWDLCDPEKPNPADIAAEALPPNEPIPGSIVVAVTNLNDEDARELHETFAAFGVTEFVVVRKRDPKAAFEIFQGAEDLKGDVLSLEGLGNEPPKHPAMSVSSGKPNELGVTYDHRCDDCRNLNANWKRGCCMVQGNQPCAFLQGNQPNCTMYLSHAQYDADRAARGGQ